MRLMFGLLGGTQVVGPEGEVPISGALRRRLLTRLLISSNESVRTERLLDDLWGDQIPASAESTLKSHVSLLRRALGGGRIESQGGGYVIVVAPDELDSRLFETELLQGQELLENGAAVAAAETLGRALDRWRGPALAEVADTDWGRAVAVRLEELKATALDSWLEARLVAGESHQVVSPAEAAVAEFPLREQLWAKLITALYRSGRQADALRSYQRLRQILADELGIDPSPDMVQLERSILLQEGGAVAALGLATDPDRSPSRLPPELTSFVPRPRELADVRAGLADGGVVTLTGPGGTGKTRLAIEVGRQAADDFERVWLVELGGITNPAHIVREIALTIGCAERVGVDLADLVVQRLSDGTNLAILDNCEHLLEGAAAVVARLRAQAPQLRILATSRAPLDVQGETVYRVPTMSVPAGPTGIEEAQGYEAVRLFAERATRQHHGFALTEDNCAQVVRLCARLDGLPLAIELAAARVRTLSLTDIERRLQDRFALLSNGNRTAPARQRTLRALIDWSYDLLGPEERGVLGRMSVFATSFDLAAAEAVAADRPGTAGSGAAGQIVIALVDQGLLQPDLSGDTGRYRMLDSIREYAFERLDPGDAQSVRAAHARHFGDLVIEAAPHFAAAGQMEWRGRLEADDENLRLALATLLDHGDPEYLLQVAAAITRYWNCRGSYGDEMALLESALDRPDASEPTRARAEALAAAGFMLFRRGGTARAQQRLAEALMLGRRFDSARVCADALRSLAWVEDRRGEPDAAAKYAEEAVEEALLSHDTYLISRAYDVRAATRQGTDPAGARADYAEALAYCAAAGDALGRASTLNNLAILELEQGDLDRAREHYRLALTVVDEHGDTGARPFIHYGLGLSALLDDDFPVARVAFGRALPEARHTGQKSLEAYCLLGLASAGALSTPDETAARLLGASSALFDRLDERPEPTEMELWDRTRAALRDHLGAAFDPAFEVGRSAPAAEVIRLAAQAAVT
jgi:predicted ATPase/DNA-binding SARP family transcriptional activator